MMPYYLLEPPNFHLGKDGDTRPNMLIGAGYEIQVKLVLFAGTFQMS